MFNCLKKNKIAIVAVLFITFLCLVNNAVAYNDSYSIPVTSGSNTLNLGTSYNGTFVDSIEGEFLAQHPLGTTKMPIRVNYSTAALVNSSTVISIPVPYQTGMKSDFSDIVFTYENNTTTIPHYLYTITANGTIAKFHIRLPLTSSGSYNFTMYYGNESATSNSTFNSSWYKYSNRTTRTFTSNTSLYNGKFNALDFDIQNINNTTAAPYTVGVFTPVVTSSDLYHGLPRSSYATTTLDSYYGYDKSGRVSQLTTHVDYPTQLCDLSVSYDGIGSIYRTVSYSSSSIYFRSSSGGDTENTTYQYLLVQAHSTKRIGMTYAFAYDSVRQTGILFGSAQQTSTPIPITLSYPPSSTFSTLSYSAPSAGTVSFNVSYTAHATNWTIAPNQPFGNIKFSYVPHPANTSYLWQISNDSNFQNIILYGNGTAINVNESGVAHINVTDYNRLAQGSFYVRLKSATASNNTVFASSQVNIIDTFNVELRITDGITGDWLNVSVANQSSGTIVYPNYTLGNGAIARNISYAQVNATMNASYSITQGATTQTGTLRNTENNVHYATIFAENISHGVPLTLTITPPSGVFYNQSYFITPDISTIDTGILYIPISRVLTSPAVANATYGIVHDSAGEAVSNTSYSVNNSTTGAFIGTYTVAPGGQYAFNATGSDTNIFTFSSQGHATVNGTIGKIQQDILMRAAPTITITVKDAVTQNNIQYFTTYLGDAQIIRSTDTGIVSYDNVTEGNYQVILQADGYQQTTRQANVTATQKDFEFYMSKTENQTILDETNFVRFHILDQRGSNVFNASVLIESMNGSVVFEETLIGSSAFTVELPRTAAYRATITKPSENISETIIIYGSGLSAYMYLYVNRDTPAHAPSLINGTHTLIGSEANHVWLQAGNGDPRITGLYFDEVTASYYNPATDVSGMLTNPTITEYQNSISAVWSIENIELSGGTIVTIKTTLKSIQTGSQEYTVQDTLVAKEDSSGKMRLVRATPGQTLKIDLGLSPMQMESISVLILIVLALMTASAGIPYASTLLPTVAYIVLYWAGWITLPTGIVVMLAVGFIVVTYDIIKKTRS